MATTVNITDVKAPQRHKSGWLRKAGLALLALAGIFCGLVAIFLWRPTAVVTSLGRTYLWTKGVRTHDAQINGRRIHFMVGGTGRPVVLVHGLGGRSDDWATVMPGLMTGGCTVYALDLLGFGASDKPDVDYSIALEAETVKQFLDQQNLEKVDLVGWSMGGWVALKLSADHPERIRTLTLIDSAGFIFNAPDPSVLRPKTRLQLEQMAALFSPKAGSIPSFYARDILRVMAGQDWIVGRALESMYSRRDLMDGKVGRVTMPVLLLWGSKDVLTPLAAGYEMHRQMEHSTLSVIEGCGHVAVIECRDRSVPMIVSFLRDH
jgi:pimeloyl-ACP methyl ester carboxylesterase